MDEHVLAERLITYDTASGEGLRAAAGFVKGWLESRELKVEGVDHDGLPVILAEAGPADGPTVVFHGHLDVVPAREGQFTPRVEGDRLIGRGAYDMKGALAAMMCALKDVAAQDHVRVRFVCVPDEEAEDVTRRSTDVLVKEGLHAAFALTGEPTDLHIGIQAKGVLALRLEISGLKAHDAFRRIETLPFSRESSDLFDRPSINLARIIGGDAFNKVPDRCTIDVDIRFLPNQDPADITSQICAIGDLEIVKSFQRAPVIVSRHNPYVLALRDAVGRSIEGDALSIGRDGSSDAISFIEAGIPAVEFGPVGGGHHGPHEWVSISSLALYRRALGDFVKHLPVWLERQEQPSLRAVDGGLA
jgi:succinyl-diaminopimelate desuccinylase